MFNSIPYLFLVLKNKRSDVVSELKRLQGETEPIIKMFEAEEVADMIETARCDTQIYLYSQSLHV